MVPRGFAMIIVIYNKYSKTFGIPNENLLLMGSGHATLSCPELKCNKFSQQINFSDLALIRFWLEILHSGEEKGQKILLAGYNR